MSETCDECGYGFSQHHDNCSQKSPNDPIWPSGKPMSEVVKDKPDMVNHPSHYGGEHAKFEPIKVIRGYGWLEGFCLGSALKYIARAGKKDPGKKVEDLRKAAWYINYYADVVENGPEA